jgi:ferredoxin
MVVQLQQPCAVRYRRRPAEACGAAGPELMRIVVDRDLCQGHGVCESEAPEVFSVGKKGEVTILDESPPRSARPRSRPAVRSAPPALRIIEED